MCRQSVTWHRLAFDCIDFFPFPLPFPSCFFFKFHIKRRLYWIRITRCAILLRKWFLTHNSESLEEASNKLQHHAFNVASLDPSLRFVASAFQRLSGSFVTFPETPRGHVLWMWTSMWRISPTTQNTQTRKLSILGKSLNFKLKSSPLDQVENLSISKMWNRSLRLNPTEKLSYFALQGSDQRTWQRSGEFSGCSKKLSSRCCQSAGSIVQLRTQRDSWPIYHHIPHTWYSTCSSLCVTSWGEHSNSRDA